MPFLSPNLDANVLTILPGSYILVCALNKAYQFNFININLVIQVLIHLNKFEEKDKEFSF